MASGEKEAKLVCEQAKNGMTIEQLEKQLIQTKIKKRPLKQEGKYIYVYASSPYSEFGITTCEVFFDKNMKITGSKFSPQH